MKRFKRHKDYGFWDQDIRLSKLSQLGDPLEKLNKGVDFEMFRTLLEEKLNKMPKGSGGCPPIADDTPDSRTVWNFREQLTDLELVEELFSLFLMELDRLHLIVNEGKIIDASFVEVPRQRNSREENAQIKDGEIPESFTENPHKGSHKDTDARWTQKNKVSYFGYKNHVKEDAKEQNYYQIPDNRCQRT